ncbi:hypothetical protein BZA05DRAFT_443223 [Tricharina praecox]|uniref:uncharacterized protein n=1 Tax=Tricharina praecox TaxID=43433 RepID=UPI00221F607C|nr:uncharacterized protein BZA05DRAFT_443223 [Tricharina praecox]KAI5854553.1 hypothetical protein BZA05DRAFT_443223 [Tricharina praecox]
MPAMSEQSQTTTSETPSGFFNSAFMEIESYFDFPAGDSKGGPETSMPDSSFRSPRLTPLASPSLDRQLSPTSADVWRGLRDSPALGGYTSSFVPPPLSMSTTSVAESQQASRAQQDGIAPIQITSSFVGQPSPPDSSGDEPDKYGPPGDISPLDSLISHMPNDSTRTIHGQVTPPEDYHKSPTLSHISSLILPTRLMSPEGSPELSPRTSPAHQRRTSSNYSGEGSQDGGGGDGGGPSKRRRSSTQSVRKSRKNSTSEEAPEVQEAKRRRFLERNRVAASKCRQKKKAWMQDLESDARDAQNTSKQLKACVGMLKEEVLQLKNELLKHNTCECLQIRQYLSNEAIRLADGPLGRSARASNASSYSYTSQSSADIPECKIHPALQDGGEYDLEMLKSAP